MPFDSFVMSAMADELVALEGGRIQRIIQPSAMSVALAVYSGGSQRWLIFSADARSARVSLSSGKLAKAFEEPSPFVMLLRKHLEDKRIEAVRQLEGERILSVDVAGGRRLIGEVMGKHSNVILADGGRVLGALKIVSGRQSRVRPISPGRTYTPPPAQLRDQRLFSPGPKINPFADREGLTRLLEAVPAETTVRESLLGVLAGASPFLVRQIALAAGPAVESPLDRQAVPSLVQAAYERYELLATRDWKPATFAADRGRRDFAPFVPLDGREISLCDSMSEAVDACLGADEVRDALEPVRREVLSEIAKERNALERRLESLRFGLVASAKAEQVMQEGQLVLAYGHLAQPGSAELAIPDLAVTIPLDPGLTVSENAERAFRRYRKLRDAAERVPPLLGETEREVGRLEDLAAFAGLARSAVELRSLRQEIRPTTAPQIRTKRVTSGKRGPLRLSLDGHLVLVGRSARENEEVTFRLAARDDLWFHARERTGAHVVLRGGRLAPEEVVRKTASLAAYYSEGRTDSSVDVDVARPSDVRKIPGAAPGRVTYRNFRTVRVRPGEGDWKPAG